MLTLKPVQSSLLVAVGWDSERNALVIEFPRGARYAYTGPEAQKHFDALIHPDTSSVGKYFLANVKNNPNLPHQRIDDAQGDKPKAIVDDPANDEKPRFNELKAPDALKRLF